MFTAEIFQSKLAEYGIGHREVGVSLAVETCPVCSSRDFKVIFRVVDVDPNEPFFGRCQKGSCQQGYSSISYFLRSGVSKSAVLGWHGKDAKTSIKNMIPPIKSLELEPIKYTPEPITPIDLRQFIEIDSWPEHPAAVYAYSRGYKPELSHSIKMDVVNNAVAFICWKQDVPVGYQLRYVTPKFKHMKTKSSPGFDRANSIFILPRHDAKTVVVCEGPFTAQAAWNFGYHGICTYGSSITLPQLTQIEEFVKRSGFNLAVAVDPDEAGEKFLDVIARYWYNKTGGYVTAIRCAGGDLNDAWVQQLSISVVEMIDFNPAIPRMRQL